ncbi:MAG: glycosyltransferase [Bacteroidales bacterium]|nr:glycosyltransferase [Bacteroidales bacterium]MCF8391347.1 glycosyltransferase [Bacteroidales bacterium]
MDLSIIIVNYNVKYFLEQCLHSVYKAIEHIEAEVFVVDNNSVDGSCSMVTDKFPWVKLIENKVNQGFSKANNQALELASGEFCLLLNPDTLVEEDTFLKCLNFMRNHKDAGALGVHMIDGRGNFLPESKRSLPTPSVAFYKIFGLSRVFPRSKLFSKYHLGNLSKDENHSVEVLSGAFMFIRSLVLKKTGYLDENFFMYGEDIDLSYRIILEGYKNYYFSETSIIHYKGESTKKSSVNYVLVFYNAMIIFARKHFTKKNARYFSILINMAIYFRAGLSILKRSIQKVYQLVLDFALIFAGFYFLTPFWEHYKFGSIDYYPPEYLRMIVPLYITIWIISLYYSGAYEKPIKFWNIFKAHLIGTLIILVLYALLPENLRFSRALILLGSVWAFLALIIPRLLLSLSGIKDYQFAGNRRKRLIIVGFNKEAERVSKILEKTRINPEIVGFVSPGNKPEKTSLGTENQLLEIVAIHKIDELVFCSEDIHSSNIIRNMTLLNDFQLEYKIAPPESLSIIGSNSINTEEDLYLIYFNSVSKEKNKRLKRLFDLFFAGFFIIFGVILFPFINNYKNILKASFRVLTGKYSWVTYCDDADISNLPKIKKGIFDLWPNKNLKRDKQIIEKLNMEYARAYHLSSDFRILWKNISKT